MRLFWSRCVKSNCKNNSFTPTGAKKKNTENKTKKKQVRKRGLFCKILETIEYSGKGFIEMEIPQLGFCHSVERLIKSRTNFLNVMKQTTIGQAFKKMAEKFF